MARVIITLKDKPRGVEVGCRVAGDAGDSELLSHIAAALAAGLAGHVNTKVHNALIKTAKKEHKNVH